MRRLTSTALVCLMAMVWLVGCGVSEKKMDTLGASIDSLSEMGLPDSVLSDAKILLRTARGKFKAADLGAAGRNFDSASTLVDKAREFYAAKMQELGPEVNGLVKDMTEKKGALTGPNLHVADSVMAQIDSLMQINYLFQARHVLGKMEKLMPALLEDEEKGTKLRKRIIGTWVETARPDGVGSTSVVKTILELNKDGSLVKKESKKGQSTDYLKEDWAFESTGSWAMKGDTVVMTVTNEKCLRQIYTQYHHKKKKWIREVKPTYDSTLAAPKIEPIAWVDLDGDFRKTR